MTCETCPDTILCWQNQLRRRQCWYCKRWEVASYDQPWAKIADRLSSTTASVIAAHRHIHVRACPDAVGASRSLVEGDPSRFYKMGTICSACRRKYRYTSRGEIAHAATYVYDD